MLSPEQKEMRMSMSRDLIYMGNEDDSFWMKVMTGAPIDADLREQILKLGPYQPEGNLQKEVKGRSHLIIVSYPRQDKRSKGNGCVIQHDFILLTVRKDLIDELKIFGMSSRHHIDDFMRGRIIEKNGRRAKNNRCFQGVRHRSQRCFMAVEVILN
ncbi:hypothetical protein TNCV_2771001 [Trichonephila clavipes]|nr:hypothetical protein TNCV_2771001 [Trichonephila clavipes]